MSQHQCSETTKMKENEQRVGKIFDEFMTKDVMVDDQKFQAR